MKFRHILVSSSMLAVSENLTVHDELVQEADPVHLGSFRFAQELAVD